MGKLIDATITQVIVTHHAFQFPDIKAKWQLQDISMRYIMISKQHAEK